MLPSVRGMGTSAAQTPTRRAARACVNACGLGCSRHLLPRAALREPCCARRRRPPRPRARGASRAPPTPPRLRRRAAHPQRVPDARLRPLVLRSLRGAPRRGRTPRAPLAPPRASVPAAPAASEKPSEKMLGMSGRVAELRHGKARAACAPRAPCARPTRCNPLGRVTPLTPPTPAQVLAGPDLSVTVDGMTLPNPFVIGSGPPGTNYTVRGDADAAQRGGCRVTLWRGVARPAWPAPR